MIVHEIGNMGAMVVFGWQKAARGRGIGAPGADNTVQTAPAAGFSADWNPDPQASIQGVGELEEIGGFGKLGKRLKKAGKKYWKTVHKPVHKLVKRNWKTAAMAVATYYTGGLAGVAAFGAKKLASKGGGGGGGGGAVFGSSGGGYSIPGFSGQGGAASFGEEAGGSGGGGEASGAGGGLAGVMRSPMVLGAAAIGALLLLQRAR